VGHGNNEGRVVAVIDSNGNGLCNDVPFSMTNVHRTLTLQTQTVSPAAANVVKTDVNYTYTNSISYNKMIYCGSLSGIDEQTQAIGVGTTLWPNPASDRCTLTFDAAGIKGHNFISLYDISGQLIYKCELPEGTSAKEIDVHGFKEGLYLVQISSEQGIVGSGKLMVVR
jgi:hypothetical protein